VENYAGINVSLELSSVCIVDAQGTIVKEAKVASEPEALVKFSCARPRLGPGRGSLRAYPKRTGFIGPGISTRP
jgi:hypothetical protein